MQLISPKRLEPFAWMLETFVNDEFISAEEKVKECHSVTPCLRSRSVMGSPATVHEG
jgi:hypothetical protein